MIEFTTTNLTAKALQQVHMDLPLRLPRMSAAGMNSLQEKLYSTLFHSNSRKHYRILSFGCGIAAEIACLHRISQQMGSDITIDYYGIDSDPNLVLIWRQIQQTAATPSERGIKVRFINWEACTRKEMIKYFAHLRYGFDSIIMRHPLPMHKINGYHELDSNANPTVFTEFVRALPNLTTRDARVFVSCYRRRVCSRMVDLISMISTEDTAVYQDLREVNNTYACDRTVMYYRDGYFAVFHLDPLKKDRYEEQPSLWLNTSPSQSIEYEDWVEPPIFSQACKFTLFAVAGTALSYAGYMAIEYLTQQQEQGVSSSFTL